MGRLHIEGFGGKVFLVSRRLSAWNFDCTSHIGALLESEIARFRMEVEVFGSGGVGHSYE